MIITTSYFGNLKKLTSVPVAICGKSPEWYVGAQYRKLAPKYDTWFRYATAKINSDEYTQEFYHLVLSQLNPQEVLSQLSKFGDDISLLCYEKPNEFCHRHLVADWLNSELGKDFIQEVK